MTATENGDLSPPWGSHSVPDDGRLDVSVGPLRLRIRLSADEVRLAHASGDWARRTDDDAEEVGAPAADDADWIRWPLSGRPERIELRPVFPDRSLVLAPEASFRLLPGTRARIYVRVPLWVALELRPGERRLVEVPTVILSDTWWGSFTEGELCYWLPTSARRQVQAGTSSPYQVICPLALSNRADEELNVEKVALRVEHLSVFTAEGRFWADETRVRYRGEDSGSEISVAGRAPEEASDAVRVSPPRTRPPSRAVHARTFARLKALSGMGGL